MKKDATAGICTRDQRLETSSLPNTQLQIPAVASSLPPPSSLTTNPMEWDKYKEYLYTNLRPNTARSACGKKR